jgi:hypothetical protein
MLLSLVETLNKAFSNVMLKYVWFHIVLKYQWQMSANKIYHQYPAYSSKFSVSSLSSNFGKCPLIQ